VAAAEQAQIWGMARVAALELPAQWGGVVDLPQAVDEKVVGTLYAVLAGGEDQVAVRPGGVFVRRLEPIPANSERVREVAGSWRPRGTVLVTGGTGGLGRHVTRWLVDAGADRVVLASRSGTPVDLGPAVTSVPCDVTNRDGLAAVVHEYAPSAVVHAAGVAQNTPMGRMTAAEFEEVLAAKVLGAVNLDEVTRELDLDAFVLFSSIAGVWGSAGQAAYAAANAFLDALASRRRAEGLPGTSVAWGPWAGSGMASRDGAVDQLELRGLRLLAPRAAIAALQHVLDHGETGLVVADVEWDRFVPVFTSARRSPLLERFAEAPVATEVRTTRSQTSSWS
jgi:NAD(P)-dependent dehydrogenase (short-subunit alcohol dehydrogenase family)